jgi:DNA repair protein RadC
MPAPQPDRKSSDRSTADGGKAHYLQHRERLRCRFLNGGADVLQDYELLEIILGAAIPRRDVKPLAKDLLTRFGGLAGIFSARPDDLTAVPGIGEVAATVLKAVEAAAIALQRSELEDRPLVTSWDQLTAYLRSAMGREQTEQFRILFLDTRNRLIRDEVQQRGTVNHTPVYPREVVRRALELGATAIILAHNHPSGDVTPSRADIDMTEKIVTAARALDITVHDHVIVAANRTLSFRTEGLM